MKFIFVYMILIFYIHDSEQKLKSEHHPLFIPNIPSFIKRQMLPSIMKSKPGSLARIRFISIALSPLGLPQTVPWFRSCMKRIRPRFRVGFRWRLVLRIHTRLNRSPIPLIRNLRHRST